LLVGAENFYFLLSLAIFRFSQDIGEWPENQILIPDWTYFHCPGTTLVIVSFRWTFTSKLHKNIGPDFANYQQALDQLNQDKLIIQFESLMQLKVHDKTIPVLDEVKSILRVKKTHFRQN